MKFKFLSLVLVLSVIMGLSFTTPVQAVGYGTAFLTSITYMNVGTATAQISVDFYSEGATTVTKSYTVADLGVGAAASLGLGVVFTSSFTGSAVISSSQPLVATAVQVPQAPVGGTTTVKNRPMSNGFSSGSTSVLIPTVLKAKFNTNSIFSVQNAGSSAADVTVNFIPTEGTAWTTVVNLAAGASKYYDMGKISNVGPVFNGSVRITSTELMVATSMELSTVNDAVYAFQGFSSGAAVVYMPSAMCKAFGTIQTSNYAIQNTSTNTATDVVVTYTNGSTVTKSYTISNLAPGAKASISGCGNNANDVMPTGFSGSATLKSTAVGQPASAGQPIVAISKISAATNPSFVAAGEGSSSGAQKLAAPYVRYSDKWYPYNVSPSVQQANIAVQNIGTTAIAANTITVQFVGSDGSVKGTYTHATQLLPGAKFSVSPKSGAGLAEFGYVGDANGKPISYGGGAIITGPVGAQLAAVVRVSSDTPTGTVAEDYIATPIQ